MAIKDKDGSVYKLRGPNPLMRTQQEWDRAKIKLINLGTQSEVVEDERNPIQEFKETYNVLDIGEELGLKSNEETRYVKPVEFIQEIQETPSEPEIVVEKPPEPEEVVITVDKSLLKIFKEHGKTFHCVPAVGFKEHRDELYESSYKTVVYGDKLLFDGLVVEESDLKISVWCIKSVGPSSIIYKQDRAERWWRVVESEPKTGGYLLSAIPSDSNPSFV